MTDSIGTAISAKTPAPDNRLLSFCIGASVWIIVTLATAVQGQFFAAYHGRSQDWWTTLGYTAAIFSVWVLLTPGAFKVADKIYAAGLHRTTATALWVLGYPVATLLHLSLFVVLFWPVYGVGFPTPVAMAKPVFLANVDKSVFAYVALIALARFRRHIREREAIPDVANSRTDDDGLWIRVAGGSRLIRFHEIDWIAAAGDYAEVHVGDRSLLTDSSLAALIGQLPENEFARIHRGAIIRLDRVREVRGLGRGDASLFLHTGQALRLSRRYRDKLAVHLPL